MNGTVTMIDDIFERQLSARLPADYPHDAPSYALLMEHARRRQSAALRALIGNGGQTYVSLAADVCSLIGDGAVSEASLRNMRAGTSVMPPRVAVALSEVLGVDPVDVLPHLEAFPWLGGRFRPELAGRTWAEIASRFDVPLAVVAMHLRAPSPPGDQPMDGEIDIPGILRSISERMRRRAPAHDEPGPSVGRPPILEDGREDASASARDVVLMSLTDVRSGVRLVYRGLMDLRRLQLVREAAGDEAWTRPGAFTLESVEGRPEPLFECDMVVPRARARRLLTALGAPLGRRGLLSRIFGR